MIEWLRKRASASGIPAEEILRSFIRENMHDDGSVARLNSRVCELELRVDELVAIPEPVSGGKP